MKLSHTILTLVAFAFLFAGCDSTGAGGGGDGGTVTYEIGDPGPAGGLVFYIDETDEFDWTFLEVAPQSTEWQFKEWGAHGTEIGGDAALTGIGDGQAATTAIVNHMEGKLITDTAAQLCDALEHEHEGTAYDDWFLPSKDELNAVYENLHQNGVGGFAENNYWSSSELFSEFAWAKHFFSGNQTTLDKANDERVRAVRAF